MTIFAGADWLDRSGHSMSPLGRRVADLLGQVYAGLYHIAQTAIDKATWDDPRCVTITLNDGPFATWDYRYLTALVVLCHDAAIRCEITAATHGYLRLRFHQRQRTGDMNARHPTLEDTARSIRHTQGHPALGEPENEGAEKAAKAKPAKENSDG